MQNILRAIFRNFRIPSASDQLQDIEEELQGIEPRKITIPTTLNLGDGEAAQQEARTQVMGSKMSRYPHQ